MIKILIKWITIENYVIFFIKPKSKQNHCKSKTPEKFDNCKHIKLSIENPNKNTADKAFYAHIMEHNKKYKYYLVKCGFQLVFNDYEFCLYITSKLFGNETMCFWQKILENAIEDFKIKGFNFFHIAEMNTMIIAKKLGMSYDF